MAKKSPLLATLMGPSDELALPMRGALSAALGGPSEQDVADESMAFAAGMHAADGSFGSALANAFGAQLAQRNKAQELRNQYLPHILGALETQMALKAQQQERDMWLGSGFGEGALAGAAPAAPGGAPGMMATSAPGGAPAGPQFGGIIGALSRQYGIDPMQLYADYRNNGGKKIAEFINDRTKPNWDIINGFQVNKNPGGGAAPGGAPRMVIPQITQDPSGGNATVLEQGADGTFRMRPVEGSREIAEERLKAEQSVKDDSAPYEYTDEEGTPRRTTIGAAKRAGLIEGVQPAAPRAAQTAAPRRQNNDYVVRGGQTPPYNMKDRVSDQVAVIQSELEKLGPNHPDAEVLVRELQRLGAAPGTPNDAAQPQSAVGVGARAGMNPSEQRINKNKEAMNEDFMKIILPGVREDAKAARALLETTNVSRKALEQLGSTGWGTDTKAAAASILGAMGVKKAEDYATSAEVFTSAANQRMLDYLAAQKGPQTDQDAQRVKSVVQRLSGTTDYNKFLLDFAEAQARIQIMKARFFQEALPRAGDDLTAIDRKWSSMAPSIFQMPSMTKWGVTDDKDAR